MVTIHDLLQIMVEKNASDLHIAVGTAPLLRTDGELYPLREYGKLDPEMCQRLAYGMMNDQQIKRFETYGELDLSYGVRGLCRVRVNVFRQRGTVGVALRNIPFKIPSFEDLGLPLAARDAANTPKGLVLVCGPTGHGKSTTLACIIDIINSTRSCHVVTVEDPIEYLHHHKQAYITQREVGDDTESFKVALKYVLRQDPDVIMIGEMRDLETIEAALVAAETGHLVFATLHTTDAAQSVNRIIDVFPPHQQHQVRTQLSFVVQHVFIQHLLTRDDGPGRVLATEVMVATPAIRNLIREGKIEQIYSVLQTGFKEKMRTMNRSLAELCKRGIITHEKALSHTMNQKDLRLLLSQSI